MELAIFSLFVPKEQTSTSTSRPTGGEGTLRATSDPDSTEIKTDPNSNFASVLSVLFPTSSPGEGGKDGAATQSLPDFCQQSQSDSLLPHSQEETFSDYPKSAPTPDVSLALLFAAVSSPSESGAESTAQNGAAEASLVLSPGQGSSGYSTGADPSAVVRQRPYRDDSNTEQYPASVLATLAAAPRQNGVKDRPSVHEVEDKASVPDDSGEPNNFLFRSQEDLLLSISLPVRLELETRALPTPEPTPQENLSGSATIASLSPGILLAIALPVLRSEPFATSSTGKNVATQSEPLVAAHFGKTDLTSTPEYLGLVLPPGIGNDSELVNRSTAASPALESDEPTPALQPNAGETIKSLDSLSSSQTTSSPGEHPAIRYQEDNSAGLLLKVSESVPFGGKRPPNFVHQSRDAAVVGQDGRLSSSTASATSLIVPASTSGGQQNATNVPGQLVRNEAEGQSVIAATSQTAVNGARTEADTTLLHLTTATQSSDSDRPPFPPGPREDPVALQPGAQDALLVPTETVGVPSLPGLIIEHNTAVAPAVIKRVAGEIFAHIDRGSNTAFIELEPVELGKLQIDLALDGDKVRVRILTEAPEVSTLIQAHLTELKNALQQHSLDLGMVSIDVNTRSGDQGSLSQGFQQQLGPQDGSSRGLATPERRNDGEEKRKRNPYQRPQNGVSVWA